MTLPLPSSMRSARGNAHGDDFVVIASVLGSFGRSGVPLYVVYPSRAGRTVAPEPRVLPQILSEGTIIDAIEKEIL